MCVEMSPHMLYCQGGCYGLLLLGVWLGLHWYKPHMENEPHLYENFALKGEEWGKDIL